MTTRVVTGRIPAPVWAAGVAAVVLIAHGPAFLHRLMDGDEAVYGSIAALMNEGGRLYAGGGVDNKPPGIFWTYAATFQVFGTYQMTAIHAVALVVMVATCALLFMAARSLAGVRAGLLAALFYGVLTAAGNPRLLAANTEIFMMLPLTASFLLTLRRRWLWSGLLLVAAGAFRQAAATELLLVPVAILLLEPTDLRVPAAVRFAGGAAIGLASGAALLALTGSLVGFWRWTVETLFGYAAMNLTQGALWQRARDSVVPFVIDMSVLWVAAIAYSLRWKRLGPQQRLIVGWLVVSMIGSLAGGHLSWHYFIQVMGPLALLAGLAVDLALRTRWKRWAAAAITIGVTVPLVGWGVFNVTADPLTYDWSPPIAQHELVAAYIRDHTKPGDRVFVWGDWPALYVESDRTMAGRFPGFLRGFDRGSGLPPNNWDTAPDVWTELGSDLARNPPTLIVDTAAAGWSDFSSYPMSNYPVLANLVASGYKPVATVDGVVIYARSVA
jgi:4-amino-4-deoxy-L-arabinose transferase-like glycosyltransferase